MSETTTKKKRTRKKKVEKTIEYRYEPTPYARKNPCWFVKGGFAIGGVVRLGKKPPAKTYVLPEATQEQLKDYYEKCLGKSLLVRKVEVK